MFNWKIPVVSEALNSKSLGFNKTLHWIQMSSQLKKKKRCFPNNSRICYIENYIKTCFSYSTSTLLSADVKNKCLITFYQQGPIQTSFSIQQTCSFMSLSWASCLRSLCFCFVSISLLNYIPPNRGKYHSSKQMLSDFNGAWLWPTKLLIQNISFGASEHLSLLL